MFLNANQIYTLQCENRRNDMMVASDNYQEVVSEAMILCRATNGEVNIYCHGTASILSNVTPEFLLAIA